MKKCDAPQDSIAMYQGGNKALYVLGDEGKFEVAQSSGWSVEEAATLQAVEEFERLENEAYEHFIAGTVSPLAVWMNRRRMSLGTLSQCTDFWQWTIKRHLKPTVFSGLGVQKLQRYCDVLDVSMDEFLNPKRDDDERI
jgi:hypothetical protein